MEQLDKTDTQEECDRTPSAEEIQEKSKNLKSVNNNMKS